VHLSGTQYEPAQDTRPGAKRYESLTGVDGRVEEDDELRKQGAETKKRFGSSFYWCGMQLVLRVIKLNDFLKTIMYVSIFRMI